MADPCLFWLIYAQVMSVIFWSQLFRYKPYVSSQPTQKLFLSPLYCEHYYCFRMRLNTHRTRNRGYVLFPALFRYIYYIGYDLWFCGDCTSYEILEFTKITMVFLPSLYRFSFDTKSEEGLRRRIKFSVDAQSPFFHRMKIESIIHRKLKTTLMLQLLKWSQ